MTSAPKIPFTRSLANLKYGGALCELTNEPSTYRQIIRYYYYLKNSFPKLNLFGCARQISSDVKSIWVSVCPNLPLLKVKNAIYTKVHRLLDLVCKINRNRSSENQKEILDLKLT